MEILALHAIMDAAVAQRQVTAIYINVVSRACYCRVSEILDTTLWRRLPSLLCRGFPNPRAHAPIATPCRLGSRRHSRFGNLRHCSLSYALSCKTALVLPLEWKWQNSTVAWLYWLPPVNPLSLNSNMQFLMQRLLVVL